MASPAPGAASDGAQFRRLLELSSDWYWEQDQHYRFIDTGASAEMQVRTGWEVRIGSTRWDNPSNDLTPEQWAAHRAVLDARQPFRDFEYSRVSGDGVLRHVSICGEPVFDAAGAFTGYRGIARDITARKQAEAEQREVQHLLDSMIEHMPIAVQLKAVADDLRVVMWNRAAETLYGVPRAEAIGRTARDLWPGAAADRIDAADQDLIKAGGVQDFPDRPALSRHRGALRLDMRKRLLRDQAGNPSHILVIADDITARKRQEQDLQRLRVAMDATTDGIYLADRASMSYLYVNQAAACMSGRPHAQIMAQGPEGAIGKPRAEIERDYDAIIESGVPEPPWESLRQRPDGSHAWIEFHRHAQQSEQGWMIIAVVRDITARKQAEAVRDSLELALRESQKMEAIGTLAGGIAHDFNNIIGAILGNVELARQDVTDPRAQESLDEIRKAGFRARSLVRQILTFSRRQPTQRMPTSLPAVVEESVRLLRATLPARVQIESHCDEQTPEVLADVTQLQQVLINLGTNAAYSIGSRTGRIGIEVSAAMLDDSALRGSPHLGQLQPGCFARINVSDTGQGMDAAMLEHIFEPFFTTKPVGEGTGLGLSVAHGIMRSHDGAILAYSTPGQGSRFELYLPATQAPAVAAAAAPPAAVTPAGAGQHVLYIDDDEALLFLTQRMLGRRGYQVTAHISPDDALAALRANPQAFDLVVTDFNMPGKSGIEVARAVREIRPGLPVAIISGYITDQLRAEADKAGVRALIFKPNAVEELCDAVQKLILTPGMRPPE